MHPNQRFLLQTASKTTKGFQPSTLLCEHSHPAQNMCPRLRGKFLEIKLKQQSRNSRSIVKQKGFQPSTLVCEHSHPAQSMCPRLRERFLEKISTHSSSNSVTLIATLELSGMRLRTHVGRIYPCLYLHSSSLYIYNILKSTLHLHAPYCFRDLLSQLNMFQSCAGRFRELSQNKKLHTFAFAER